MSTTWIAVDGGQSTTRARASWSDADVEIGGFVHTAEGASVIVRQVAALLALLPAGPTGIDRLVVGHTGLPVDDAARAGLADALLGEGLANSVVLAPDEVTAHAGAFAGRPGVVTAVGTGSVTLAVDEDGRGHRVDGWGHLFGDAGSAYSIARAALDAGLRALDGRGPATALADLARDEFGAGLRDATWELYADPQRVDRVARFAPRVVAAAITDDVAAGIVASAGTEIARSCTAAADALVGVHDVAVVGRLLAAGTTLDYAFRTGLAELAPHLRVVEPVGVPLDGSAWIARSGPSLYRDLLHRGERPA